MKLKLGRTPRTFDPRIAKLSMMPHSAAAPPVAVDYTPALGTSTALGMMGNDTLGDCTCAAFYHALQVWSANATGVINTQPTKEVIKLYEWCCGYVPGDPNTDQGGNEQAVLTYLYKHGAPTTRGHQKIDAFYEIDVFNLEDVKSTIYDCGVSYIGFNVPSFVMDNGTIPGSVWDVQAGDANIVGGHAVVLAGYDANTATVISWGALYKMTWAFFSKYVDESYALVSNAWIAATGKSPSGLSKAQLEAAMAALHA